MSAELPQVPKRGIEHVHHAVKFSPKAIHQAMKEVEGFNATLAVLITRSVGTMGCAYLFAFIALISLPAALATGQLIVIVAWIAQTFLQLVLLSVIMVGQRVQAASTDAKAETEFANVVKIMNMLDHLAKEHQIIKSLVRDGNALAEKKTIARKEQSK